MPNVVGPCRDCGVKVKRRIKPDRPLLCVECGLARMQRQREALKVRTGPALRQSIEEGQETARQIAAKSGPRYDKWLAGMIGHLQRETATPDD